MLVTRYRPRGLPKKDETWDEWIADLGPSAELHAAAYGKGRLKIDWNTYRSLYLREMKSQTARITQFARDVMGGQTITLLCSSACVREVRCHRLLLRKLIEAEVAKLTAVASSSARLQA